MGKNTPLRVAVVVPNRNYGAYLGKALQSVRNQTVAPTEVIVVDGGSTDRSEEIAKVFGARWIETPPRGQADARNVGIAATDCEFIVPLDADDWIEPDYIEQCLPFMDPGVGVVAPGLIWPDGRVQWPTPPFTIEMFMTGNRLFCCSMFRRACWEEVGGYDPGPTYEDWAFWFSIVCAGWKIALVRKPLFHYCPHLNSSTTNMDPSQHSLYVRYIQKKFGG